MTGAAAGRLTRALSSSPTLVASGAAVALSVGVDSCGVDRGELGSTSTAGAVSGAGVFGWAALAEGFGAAGVSAGDAVGVGVGGGEAVGVDVITGATYGVVVAGGGAGGGWVAVGVTVGVGVRLAVGVAVAGRQISANVRSGG